MLFILLTASDAGFDNKTEKNTTDPEPAVLQSLLDFVPITIISAVSIGLPLNLLIAGLIITQSRLHKPRHIFWLGVTFSCIFAQLLSLDELLVFYIFPDYRPACLVFVLLVDIPYANLLLNIFFCLVDRYVAITNPMGHKKQMTICRIITAQLIGFLLISILFKISYFLDDSLSNIHCYHTHQHQPHGKIIVFTLMALVLLCFVSQIVVYFKSKTHFINRREGQCQPLSQKTELSLSRLAVSRHDQLDIVDKTEIKVIYNRRDKLNVMVHVNSETTNKLEVEAAQTLALGVSSLLLISSPIFIASLSVLFCSQGYGDCTAATWIIPYFRELILVHTIYKPIVYIWRSRELFSATGRSQNVSPGQTTHVKVGVPASTVSRSDTKAKLPS